ncbi:nuclear transport factor 2 family protein [Saprospiraceae bacterium]|nr:nuclear transport factor 2 family protein [Saprospiraceae bacterium]
MSTTLPFRILLLSITMLLAFTAHAQNKPEAIIKATVDKDFTDRQAVITAIENFYIGDHTGSIKHKKLSMHEKGAYRYINRNGEYSESVFRLDSDDSDMNYKEELLSIEIYDKLAIARLRLDQVNSEKAEYKVMTLHKAKGQWKITTISWGFGITH